MGFQNCLSNSWILIGQNLNIFSDTVFVTAAAGALGLAAVDLAANVFGAKVSSSTSGIAI